MRMGGFFHNNHNFFCGEGGPGGVVNSLGEGCQYLVDVKLSLF